MDLFATIQQVIATALKVPPDKITRETSEKDLVAWDSIAHINLMMSLEETFELFIEVEDFAKLTSVPAIVEYLREQGSAGQSIASGRG
jgi:acyl carrier protein